MGYTRRTLATRRRQVVALQWPGAESNCRHADFQSAALPTELPGRAMQQTNLADRLVRWECQCLPLFAFCLPLCGPRTASPRLRRCAGGRARGAFQPGLLAGSRSHAPEAPDCARRSGGRRTARPVPPTAPRAPASGRERDRRGIRGRRRPWFRAQGGPARSGMSTPDNLLNEPSRLTAVVAALVFVLALVAIVMAGRRVT